MSYIAWYNRPPSYRLGRWREEGVKAREVERRGGWREVVKALRARGKRRREDKQEVEGVFFIGG